MDGHTINLLLNNWLGVMLDAALTGAVFLLWLSWFRNGRRQQRLEQMLVETSSQLEAATRHLSQATEAIEQLKRCEQTKRCEQPSLSGRRRVNKPASTPPQQAETQAPATPLPTALPAQNSTQATMILRMQREGESPQTIAERLDMPLAQVKLLLKLNAASGTVAR